MVPHIGKVAERHGLLDVPLISVPRNNKRNYALFNLMEKIYPRYVITLIILMAACTQTLADNFTLTGKVVDEEHNPIELATVSCLEQGKVTATNLK